MVNHEVITQIGKSTREFLNSKHGPFYAGLIVLSTYIISYLLIDNKYGISVGEKVIKPQCEETQEIL